MMQDGQNVGAQKTPNLNATRHETFSGDDGARVTYVLTSLSGTKCLRIAERGTLV